MAVSVGDEAEDGDILDDALIYAADNGAHIITLSLKTAETQAISDALNYAYSTMNVFIDCVSQHGRRWPILPSVMRTSRGDTVLAFWAWNGRAGSGSRWMFLPARPMPRCSAEMSCL